MNRTVEGFLEDLDEAALRELAARLQPYLASEPGQLLDAQEAAERLGLHPETVVRMARAGRIPASKVGREWRFRTDRLDVLPVAPRGATEPVSLAPPRATSALRPSVAAIRGKMALRLTYCTLCATLPAMISLAVALGRRIE